MNLRINCSSAVLASLLSVAATCVSGSPKGQDLGQDSYALVSSMDSQIGRDAAARICSAFTEPGSDGQASPELVGNLKQALRSRNTNVRYLVIRTLALIGPRSASALPDLRQLLRAAERPEPGSLMFGISFVPQLRNAIDVIEGRATGVRSSVSEECDAPVRESPPRKALPR